MRGLILRGFWKSIKAPKKSNSLLLLPSNHLTLYAIRIARLKHPNSVAR